MDEDSKTKRIFGAATSLLGGLSAAAWVGLDTASPEHVHKIFTSGIRKVMDKSGLSRERQLRLVKILRKAVDEIVGEE